jgi:hypothetical protein
MSISREIVPVEFGFDGGLNLSPYSERIADNEASEIVNFDIVDGALVKRPGIIQRGLGDIYAGATGWYLIGQGYFANSNNNLLAVGMNNKLYHSTGGGLTWTELLDGGLSFSVASNKAIQYGVYLCFGSVITGFFIYNVATQVASVVASSPLGLTGDVVLDYFFVFNPSTQAVRYCEPGDITSWPVANTFSIAEDGPADYIQGMVAYKDRLVIFRRYSIYVLNLSGTPANWQLRKLYDGVGANGAQSMKVHDDWIYFIGDNGIYRTNLSELQEISGPLKNKMKDRDSGGATSSSFDPYLTYDAVAAYRNKVYCFINFGIEQTGGQELYVFHTDSETWTKYESEVFGSDTIKVTNPLVLRYVRNASNNDNAYPMGMYLSFLGEPRTHYIDDHINNQFDEVSDEYVCRVKTKAYTFEDVGSLKKIPYSFVDLEVGADVALEVKHNEVTVKSLPVGTFDGSRQSLKIPGPGDVKRVQSELIFTSSGEDRNVVVKKMGHNLRVPRPVEVQQVGR